ncbi:PLP-dependent cysteine synthase family protein [Dyella flava]|uniref:cysteine synthase n=1 Tax=Dyella flava TaxID=1920170 RepID=A0ABS2K2W1_9GAMM|nr:pyridoxal-phosphate dependent enzyme [Dyella flava]MBM7125491.1 pyridoxal-phosphate dependent enzyme [Dyella flava]GLQ51648.1 pyridoxal-5'-phosphate-dependent protein [Dyella flava]
MDRADFRTPLREVMPGVLMKFECDNPGGSHKVRAAYRVIDKGIRDGHIVPGKTTIIEKTGGNFGFGLAVVCNKLQIPVELAVGLGFSAIKRRYLEMFGARLIGVELLKQGATPKEVVSRQLEQASRNGRSYFYTDQFSNIASIHAHEFETGREIVEQLHGWPTVKRLVFVACAGTGASFTGVARALMGSGYEVSCVLVEPEGCDASKGVFVDHPFEGMSVGVSPPFLDWGQVQDRHAVTFDAAMETRRWFCQRSGYFIGNTTAACLTVARRLAERMSDDQKVVMLFYDHGLWYSH